jgi:KaiC/GvpD/RAD55 family RecA-like ATPase
MLERQVLTSLIRRDAWLRFGGLFDAHFFSTETYRTIFRMIRSFWAGYDGDATEIPKALLFGKIESEVKSDDTEATLKKTLDLIFEDDLDFELVDGLVRDVLFRWRTQDYLVSAAQELEDGGLDLHSLVSKFNALARATEAEQEDEPSLVDEALALLESEAASHVYPTGLAELDFQLKGGLWAGEEGIILAPSFRGKTWALVHFGAEALRQGTPVQHHTCEISRRRTGIRYYQNLLNSSRLQILEHPVTVAEKLQDLSLPQWSIKDWSGSAPTTSKIRREVQDFVEKCDKPPLIVVDYMDLTLPADRKLEGRFALTAVAQELREIAAEFGVGLWTATQANRPSWSKSHVEMSDVSEAIGKVEKADLIVTLNQTSEEKSCGTMRFIIEKARERVISKHIIPTVALSEVQRFDDVPDGF